MRLIRLRVANFGCVRQADIHFGERLNVLYGRNDLGKSSLVAAIRAALFLQHDSSVHRPYVTWQASEQPHVELTLLTEPQRYYRIRKTFGSKGRSILEESRDGATFLNPIKGRQVDGVIRSKLLPWGIPEPGGKRRERSMPSSFLSAALLAEQTQVTAMFDRQLAGDGDESGKKLLSDALQATARDPLFTEVMQAAQDKVGEAFTATGRRKRGRASPFHQVAQDIASTKTALDDTQKEAEQGERVRAQLTDLENRLLAKHGELEEVERMFGIVQSMADTRAQLSAARAELARVEDILQQAQDAQDAQAQAIDKAEALHALRAASDDEVRDAQSALERARAQVAEAKSAASDVQVKLQALDAERADLQRRLGEARQRQQAAEQARRAEDMCAELSEKIAALESDDTAMMARIRDREQLAENEADLHVLNGVALLLRWRDADEKLAASYEVAVELAILMTDIEDTRNQADELEIALLERALPDHETMAHLRELDAQLRVAEGALSVGLSAVIESAIGLRMEATRDDGETESLGDVRGRVEVAADRTLTLTLPNLATIRITGGNDLGRARVRRVRTQWQEQAVPVLEAAGASSLAEMDEKLDEYSKDVYRLRELRESVEQSWDKAEMQRQRLLDAEPLRKLRAELDEQLDSYDRDHVSDRIDLLEDECADSDHDDIDSLLKSEIDTLSWDIEALRQRVRQAEVDAAEDKARLDGLRARLVEARAERERVTRELDAPWSELLEAADADSADCQAKLRALDSERERVVADSGDTLELAEAAVRSAQQRVADADAERERVSAEHDRARSEQTRLDYECEHKTALAEKTDIGQCRARLATLTDELGALRAHLPEQPDADGSDDHLSALQADVGRKQREIRDIEREREQALGALRGTGGDRLRERVSDLSEQYSQLERAQLELESNYDAWQLLLSTLREVEQEQAAHLGRAMVEPITARFRELTASRYGALALGPNLETQGIYASGERRDVDRLSVGTKEQLSTLFRLSLAETLGSAVLLDDQLTQTDPERMSWFRQQMRQLSEDIQIIVFTCRVEDYLGETLPPRNGDSATDLGFVRAIRLDDLVDRM